MAIKLLSKIRNIEIIAKGNSIKVRKSLEKKYGIGQWRKLKGEAYVKINEQEPIYVEVHWYEAHGLGQFEFKVKKIL